MMTPLEWAETEMRRIETRIAVKTGFACPEPNCGLRYRHQHDEIWWPPEGEPWPPRPWVRPEGDDSMTQPQQRLREDAAYRDAVMDWLRANDIDPSHCPDDARASIADGQLTIDTFVIDQHGNLQRSTSSAHGLARETVTVPVKIAPTGHVLDWLTPRCPTCGR